LYTLKLLPNLPKLRVENELPKFTKSNTLVIAPGAEDLIYALLHIANLPDPMLTLEPNRANALIEILEPKLRQSKRLIDSPILENDLTLKEDPSVKKSMTETFAPKSVLHLTEVTPANSAVPLMDKSYDDLIEECISLNTLRDEPTLLK
jgi:hypothetical protein